MNYYVKLFLLVKVLTCTVAGMKVNMQGSLGLGKEVMDSLSFYLGSNFLSGRRSLMPVPVEDSITLTIRSALLCKDLDFCSVDLSHFVNEYISILAKSVESVMNSSLPKFNSKRYEQVLTYRMDYIRKILGDANANAKADDNEVYYWIWSIKKINAKFQEMINAFVPRNDKHEVRKALNHKIVTVSAFIERKYMIKLCVEHDLCSKSYECTTALNKILIKFKTLPDDRIRLFLRYVYKNLFNTSLYAYLSQSAAQDFQIVLNDIVYSNDTLTKDVMTSLQKTVEARLEILKSNKALEVAHDILIAHTILSDVDHIFSNRIDPFIMFLNHFYEWLSSDVAIGKHIRATMADISNEIWSHDEDIRFKIVNEVEVFLEMTVGSEK